MITQHELLDTAIKKVGNRYLATMLVAKRIRQLHHGVPPRVQRDEGESDFSVTVQEIAEGLLVLDVAADTPDAESNGTVKEVLTPAEDTAQEQWLAHGRMRSTVQALCWPAPTRLQGGACTVTE